MSINDIPEDLFSYFPLVLGSTSKRFNKKINIYTRPIVVLGDPLDESIDYKRLKKLDITFLQKISRVILLQKIKPHTLRTNDIDDIIYVSLQNLKNLTIKKITLGEIPKLEKMIDKIDIIVEHLVIENRNYHTGVFSLLRKLSIEKITVNEMGTLFTFYESDLLNIKTEYFVIDQYFRKSDIEYLNKWINHSPNIRISIESLKAIDNLRYYIEKINCKKIFNVDCCIENLDHWQISMFVEYNLHGDEYLIDFITKNNICVIGDINKIKGVFDTIRQPKQNISLIYEKIKTSRFDIRKVEQNDSD